MSNDGVFRAKYKKVPPQQKPAKSATNAAVGVKCKVETESNLKSIMKVSAPHLTCYSKSGSKESLASTRSSLSKISISKINLVDGNSNIETNNSKESSECLSINTLSATKSRTDFGTAENTCIKTPIVNDTKSTTKNGNARSKSLNGLLRKISGSLLRSSNKKETQSHYGTPGEDTESIVRELESKLKSSSTSKSNAKLKRSKSVKFNLEPERTTAESNPQLPLADLETAIRAANEIPGGLLANVQEESTIAEFFTSFLPASWSTSLNPIPAITRSSTGFLIAAYDIGARIIRTGMQIANSILSDGIAISEPREDIIQYNGFTIRTYGRELLLQSLYINYEQRQDGRHRTHHRHRPSSASSSASSVGSRPSCNCIFNSHDPNNTGRSLKMRIVIEVTAISNTSQAEHSYLANGETRVVREGSRWSLIYGSMMEGLVEIDVPDTTRPENIVHRGPIDGIIIIDIL